MHFDRAAKYDFDNFRKRGPRAISAVAATEDGLTVRLTARSGRALKQFRLGNRVVMWADNISRGKDDRRKSARSVRLVVGGTIGAAPDGR